MNFDYDTLNRISATKLIHQEGDPTLRTETKFLPMSNYRTTTLAQQYINTRWISDTNKVVLSQYDYTYDNNGNISTVKDAAGNLTTYTYDQLNQLVRVDDQKAGNTVTYDYDVGGNITRVRYYLYSTGLPGNAFLNVSYSYDDDNWKDLLTSYDGQFLTYDQIGNPLAYRDGMSFTWAGRQLTTATVNGKTSSYTYNQEGIRTSKTVDGTLTDYLVDGSTIVAQRTGYDTLWFMYDSDGTRVGFTYHDDAYYYMKNAQGDVTGIVDSDLNVVVEYSYDAWGKLIETTGSEANLIGELNPFLYRGYYYDAEIGMYYLNSRYYDPQTGRFLNADGNISSGQDLNGTNIFQYSGNNPIMRADNQGDFWHIAIGAVIGGVIAGVAKMISNKAEGKGLTEGVATAAFFGAIGGALAVTGVGLLGQAVGGAVIGMANNATDQLISNKGIENFSISDMVIEGTVGAVAGKLGGAGTGSYALKHSAKLMNKNAIAAIKNNTKNGVKGAIKMYASSRPVKRFYTNLARDIPKMFGGEMAQNFITSDTAKNSISSVVSQLSVNILQGGNNVTIYPIRY
ncbi:RHS repeat domain-containing protein [Faecalispora jeddahensis]|uniref:RHS repeat domain-containing protein n=1 Tax=Faecalispora jeddahensis TaxID=1414721 RepID=UPI0027B91931|nr:RHS repeat-associated core domain-containing protein [Faecalispora jeddahensis]